MNTSSLTRHRISAAQTLIQQVDVVNSTFDIPICVVMLFGASEEFLKGVTGGDEPLARKLKREDIVVETMEDDEL